MATYYDDNKNEITYEQWKANKEKKEAEKLEAQNAKKENVYKGNRKLAKQTWEFLTKRQTVNQFLKICDLWEYLELMQTIYVWADYQFHI